PAHPVASETAAATSAAKASRGVRTCVMLRSLRPRGGGEDDVRSTVQVSDDRAWGVAGPIGGRALVGPDGVHGDAHEAVVVPLDEAQALGFAFVADVSPAVHRHVELDGRPGDDEVPALPWAAHREVEVVVGD